MRSSSLVYAERLQKTLKESRRHLERVDVAFGELSKKYSFPIKQESFKELLEHTIDLAFADQIIYRFSKAQDCIGAKLFKAFVTYQGESADRPFRDILNLLEKLDVVDVDKWFELREVRNEIAHDYEDSEDVARNILNSIFEYRIELRTILNNITQLAR